MIFITSKKENFRRCGVSHPKAATEYPDDKFTEEEIAVLEADPMLVVEYAGDPAVAETPALEDMTVAELKKLIDKLGLAYNMRAPKAALIETIKANTAEPPVEAD